jgi:hypothetical protein
MFSVAKKISKNRKKKNQSLNFFLISKIKIFIIAVLNKAFTKMRNFATQKNKLGYNSDNICKENKIWIIL